MGASLQRAKSMKNNSSSIIQMMQHCGRLFVWRDNVWSDHVHVQITVAILVCFPVTAPLLAQNVESNPNVSVAQALVAPPTQESKKNETVDTPLNSEKEQPIPDMSVSETSWGKFQIGSWIRTRTTTTTFKEPITQNIAESTTTLEAIEADGILLKQTDYVELGGKTVQGEPQLKKIDFYKQPLVNSGTVQKLPSENIQIGNRVIRCGVRVYEQTTPQARRRTKVWYNPRIAPYVLCTETTKTSIATPEQPTEKPLGHSISIVLSPPATTLRGSVFGSYQVQTFKQNTDGTVVSLADCSLWVPGGIENEKSWEYDLNNNLVRTHTTTYTRYVYPSSDKSKTRETKVVEVDAPPTSQPNRR